MFWALCRVSCSCGRVPSPNKGKICPFPSSLIAEVLTTLKRIWEIDAKYTGLELLWRGGGPGQSLHSPCAYGHKQEQSGITLRGKLLAAFLLLQPFWTAEQVGEDSILQCVCAHVLLRLPCSLPSCPAVSDEYKDQNQIFYCSFISNFNQQIWSQPPRWKYWE